MNKLSTQSPTGNEANQPNSSLSPNSDTKAKVAFSPQQSGKNNKKTIRILIVEDQHVCQKILQSYLEPEPDLEIIGTAIDGQVAIELVNKLKPDVVLMDMNMPRMDGLTATEIIANHYVDTKILILSTSDNVQDIQKSIELGARGYLLKNSHPQELVTAIRSIHQGYFQLGKSLIEKLDADSTTDPQKRFDYNHSSSDLITQSKSELMQSQTNKTALASANSELLLSDEQPKRLVFQKVRLLMLLMSGLLVFLLTSFGRKWASQLPIFSIAQSSPTVTAQSPESTSQESNGVANKAQNSTPAINAIAALGKLEPQGEIIRISAPASLEGTRVTQILVKEGDKVRKGQVVAILDSRDRRLAALEKAEADVQIALARLDTVKAGAKAGDINAQKETIRRLEAELKGEIATQKTTIARLEAELRNAEVEYRRNKKLHKDGAISSSDLDSRRLILDTTVEQLNEAKALLQHNVEAIQRQLSEAKATLDSITEIRPVDVQVAQAELNSALAAAKQAQAELDLTYTRATTDGQILKVHIRPGEVIGTNGIAEIGNTNQMYVVAEVYETDIGKVRVGQETIITSAAFPGKLRGEVAQIGLQVNQQNTFENNPLVDTDNKVVEVKIRLDSKDSQRVAGFSNLQVQVVIKLAHQDR